MDFSKVKLVVSDMDGTLLNSNHEMSKEFFNLYTSLQAKGIHFAAASGRQHHSIEEKLSTIKDSISIISDNGASGRQGEKEFHTMGIALPTLLKAVSEVKKVSNVAIVLCAKKHAYFEKSHKHFADNILQYYSNYKIVDDFVSITNDVFFKIAIFHPECSETHILPKVKHLEEEFQVVVSGKNWVDISGKEINKGVAVQKLQELLGVTKAETMAFGDYNNDLKMLAQADFSFAMKNAHPNVKEAANFETLNNDERGVEHILRALIAKEQ